MDDEKIIRYEEADEKIIEWAIRKYWDTKTDKELALSLHTTIERIQDLRKKLGLDERQESLKDYARRRLMNLSLIEKHKIVESISTDSFWKMAEGQPAASGDLTINHEPLKIDITHQLLKVYGPDTAAEGAEFTELPPHREGGRLTTGSGE